MNNDLEIARKVKIRPIAEIAAKLGIAQDLLEPYGHYKAKLPLVTAEIAPTSEMAPAMGMYSLFETSHFHV